MGTYSQKTAALLAALGPSLFGAHPEKDTEARAQALKERTSAQAHQSGSGRMLPWAGSHLDHPSLVVGDVQEEQETAPSRGGQSCCISAGEAGPEQRLSKPNGLAIKATN